MSQLWQDELVDASWSSFGFASSAVDFLCSVAYGLDLIVIL